MVDVKSSGIMAGSPCPVEVMKKVISRMHLKHMTVSPFLTSPVKLVQLNNALLILVAYVL